MLAYLFQLVFGQARIAVEQHRSEPGPEPAAAGRSQKNQHHGRSEGFHGRSLGSIVKFKRASTIHPLQRASKHNLKKRTRSYLKRVNVTLGACHVVAQARGIDSQTG